MCESATKQWAVEAIDPAVLGSAGTALALVVAKLSNSSVWLIDDVRNLQCIFRDKSVK